jgi:hypothetical protein
MTPEFAKILCDKQYVLFHRNTEYVYASRPANGYSSITPPTYPDYDYSFTKLDNEKKSTARR